MAQVILSPVPAGSALQDRLKTAYFHDSYQLQLPDDGSSPMALYLRCVGRTPGWIDFLMRLRNRVVAPFGIKVRHYFQLARYALTHIQQSKGLNALIGIAQTLHQGAHDGVGQSIRLRQEAHKIFALDHQHIGECVSNHIR